MPKPLILASSSPYRKALLERLGLPFAAIRPATDEAPLAEEAPTALATRLAAAKAMALARQCPDHLIIGSDQVAALGTETLGKPGSARKAFAQLQRQSGETVVFHTAVAVLDSATGHCLSHLDTTRVVFRPLNDSEIRRYLDRERPWDCAGSFKVESLGITLFEQVDTRDPTALTGLPLIGLSRLLRELGVGLP